MPSPRAVLADITDLGLHPGDAHSVVGANGRLKVSAPVVSPTTVEEAPKAPEPVKVEEPVEPVEAAVEQVEQVVVEQPEVSGETESQPDASAEEKKPKRGKKAAPVSQ